MAHWKDFTFVYLDKYFYLTCFEMLFALEMEDGPSGRDHFMRSGFPSGRNLGNRGKCHLSLNIPTVEMVWGLWLVIWCKAKSSIT